MLYNMIYVNELQLSLVDVAKSDIYVLITINEVFYNTYVCIG